MNVVGDELSRDSSCRGLADAGAGMQAVAVEAGELDAGSSGHAVAVRWRGRARRASWFLLGVGVLASDFTVALPAVGRSGFVRQVRPAGVAPSAK